MNDKNNTHDLDVILHPTPNMRAVWEARRQALLIELYAIEDYLGIERSMTARDARRRARELMEQDRAA